MNNECKEALILQEAIYFALAKTNNTQIKLKEEQKEAVCQIVNGRDVKSLIYQLLPSMFDYINSRKKKICRVNRNNCNRDFPVKCTDGRPNRQAKN